MQWRFAKCISVARSGESPLNLGEFEGHRGILGDTNCQGNFSGENRFFFRGI